MIFWRSKSKVCFESAQDRWSELKLNGRLYQGFCSLYSRENKTARHLTGCQQIRTHCSAPHSPYFAGCQRGFVDDVIAAHDLIHSPPVATYYVCRGRIRCIFEIQVSPSIRLYTWWNRHRILSKQESYNIRASWSNDFVLVCLRKSSFYDLLKEKAESLLWKSVGYWRLGI
jgi:hypothetical protein